MQGDQSTCKHFNTFYFNRKDIQVLTYYQGYIYCLLEWLYMAILPVFDAILTYIYYKSILRINENYIRPQNVHP